MHRVLGIPSHPRQTVCHVQGDRFRVSSSSPDTVAAHHKVKVSKLPDTGSNAATGLGFHHSDRQWGVWKAERKQPSRAQGRGLSGEWSDEMFRHLV